MDKVIQRPQIIFLDVIDTLVNMAGIKSSIAKLLNNRLELGEAWFSNMLLYSQVDTLLDDYHEFWKIAMASFEMVAQTNHIQYNSNEVFEYVKRMNVAPAYPEVENALANLKGAGYQLVTLTNSSKAGIHTQLTTNSLDKYIDQMISTDDIGYFKPHPHTYLTASRILNVSTDDCLLISSHGWDIAGANRVGMYTAFLNRNQYAFYPLSDAPHFNEVDLKALSDKLCIL